MKRALLVVAIVVIIVAAVVAVWRLRTSSSVRQYNPLKATVESAITNPVAFAKSHFTGAIGAILVSDPKTGAPVIHNVIAGSPAEMAGLRDGDVVLKVDGVPTSGQKLPQVADSIRGFAGGSVTLTIQRAGSTNVECVLHRSSWKRLGVPQ